MIERLRRALDHLDELSPEAQQDLAQQIEDQTEPLEELEALPATHNLPVDETLPPSVRVALALGGAWSDLQDDDEFAALDRIRHESPPRPPIEDKLAWLNGDDHND